MPPSQGSLLPPQANVICVVYAVDDAASFQRLRTHWLPTIRRVLGPEESRSHVPVILVGNKVCTGRHVASFVVC